MSPIILNPYVGASGAVGTDPLSILGTSCWRWLKRGKFYTDAGSTLVSANGDQAQQWSDFSGNNRHATQSTSASRPTWDTGNTRLGVPGVRCDSSVSGGQYFSVPSMNGLTEGEVFLVLKLVAQPASSSATSGLWHSYGADNFETDYPATDGNGYVAFGYSRQGLGSLAGQTLTVYHVLSLRTYTANNGAFNNPNNNFQASINGTVVYNDGGAISAGTASFPAGAQDLGRSNSGVKGNLWLWEEVISSTVCTPTQRAAMIAYLTT